MALTGEQQSPDERRVVGACALVAVAVVGGLVALVIIFLAAIWLIRPESSKVSLSALRLFSFTIEMTRPEKRNRRRRR